MEQVKCDVCGNLMKQGSHYPDRKYLVDWKGVTYALYVALYEIISLVAQDESETDVCNECTNILLRQIVRRHFAARKETE
tara:strand:+ start:5769 stop:6008 length:240 start_codon:yes stop_codon:yes gene_type:complete